MPDLNLLTYLIAKAKAAGADAADAVAFRAASLSVAWRLGKTEGVERAEAEDLGLRVFVGRRQAVVSSTDKGAEALEELVERALAMARGARAEPVAAWLCQTPLSVHRTQPLSAGPAQLPHALARIEGPAD